MLETYYYSDEWSQEEKDNLIKKTAYFMGLKDYPQNIIRPEQFVYDKDGKCAGYTYQKPLFPYITLKELFQPENMRKYHVDGRMLLSIAKSVLGILVELSEKRIYPGFIDLSYLLVHAKRPEEAVLISNPEHFQVENMPSTYPWYPSDGRLFEEDFELFNEIRQKKADAKLIYKILTAASKGNAKIPPNQKAQELSWLYWNSLSREWKDYFGELNDRVVNYKELRELLFASLEEENTHSSAMEEKGTEKDSQKAAELAKKKAYALVAILRQAEKSAHDVSRELYLLQEKLEMHPHLDFAQGFVIGNKHPIIREFRQYPKEYRSQLGHVISEYSFGEVLIIASEMMEAAVKKEERPSILFILLDGEIKNDKVFQIAIKKLAKLRENCYTKLMLLPIGKLKGEGYQKLYHLCMKGN